MHFFWRGSCSAQVLSWCLHNLWGQRLLLRSALQVRCARSPEGRAPRTPRREGQSRVGSTDPSVFLWAQENSLNVPIAPCPYYCRLDKPMRLSRNGLGDNEGEPSCAGSVRGLPTAAHRATTLAAGLLQMATWDEMKEYGVDQNTISYNSLLSRSKEPRRNGGTRMGSQTAAVRLRPGHQGRQGFSACSPPRRRHAQCSSCLQSCKAHGWATQIKGLATAPSTSLVAQNR